MPEESLRSYKIWEGHNINQFELFISGYFTIITLNIILTTLIRLFKNLITSIFQNN